MIVDQVYNQDKTSEKALRAEQTLRSIETSISWRILGTLDTILISWVINGTLSLRFQ